MSPVIFKQNVKAVLNGEIVVNKSKPNVQANEMNIAFKICKHICYIKEM